MKNFFNNENVALALDNKQIFIYYRDRLINLYMSRFKWTMPETCDQWFLERTLLNQASATILKEKYSQFWLSVGYTYSGHLNVYGYPTNIKGVGYANYVNIEPDKFVIIFDNMSRTSTLQTINIFAALLWEIHQTYRSNLQTQTTPYLIAAPKNMQLSIKNILLKLFGKSPVLELAPSFDPEMLKVLDLKVDFKGKDMLDNLKVVWNMALGMIGVMAPTEKRERLISTEVSTDQSENITQLNSALMARRIAVDKLNKIQDDFEFKVDIADISEIVAELHPYNDLNEGVYDNGSLHNNDI